MQKTRSRIVVIAISMFLMVSMSASMILIPNANAHTPAWNIQVYAYISVAPNPVGVGQPVTVYMWLNQVYDQSSLYDNYRFHNYQLTITAPNGAKTQQTFAYISDPTSSQYTIFTPNQVGTYTFNFTFPGQAVNDYPHATMAVSFYGPPTPDQYINDTYLPAAASTTLTVQQTPIPAATGSSPLPSAYWARPIYGENTAWYTISSNWLGDGAPGYMGIGSWSGETSNPQDAVGPLTAHVMWTTPLQAGGVVGGNETAIQGDTYFEGSAYNNRFTNPIVMDGLLYYQAPINFYSEQSVAMGGSTGTPDISGTFCVNLQTGQQVWESTAIPTGLSFGYIYDLQDPNQHGVIPPLLVAAVSVYNQFFVPSTTWQMYDAYTGISLWNITNVPTGDIAPALNGEMLTPMGPSGEFLNYVLTNYPTATNPNNWYLAEWNSSRLWNFDSSAFGTPQVLNPDASASSMYDWNISIPYANTIPTAYPGATPFSIIAAYYNDILVCLSGTLPSGGNGDLLAPQSNTPYTYFAINLNPSVGAVGKILWTNTLQPPAGNISVTECGSDPVNRVFVESYEETRQWVGYSMDTGQKLWGPIGDQAALAYYGNPDSALAYGNLYTCGFSGLVYCYNDKTGALKWTYGNGGEGNSTYGGLNVAYGYYPTFIQAIGSGVVYLITTEHTVETPIYKGALARAINATTGAQIWALSDYTGEFIGPDSYAIADGYATFFNGYDNSIYSVGRGPSDTTVQAPLTAVSAGNSVIIQGTVMDVSAGTKQTEQAADFPNGVPVSSDGSMMAWMGYVYQQQPAPTNFTGVTVILTAIDPNGNYITLGTAKTDATGHFIYSWQTPQVPGKYAITATFAGTNGYWGSSDETGMIVQSAQATPAPTATPLSGLASNTTLMYGIISIIIVIIIIGAVLAVLVTRKHP